MRTLRALGPPLRDLVAAAFGFVSSMRYTHRILSHVYGRRRAVRLMMRYMAADPAVQARMRVRVMHDVFRDRTRN